ncbi:ArgP/LysG family DNA-binding transcriptional regulator [Nocardioides bruguierae]|uniref:ArgP/LysG family DNA-binding transcriptional regulator n=1 Tax=Nocardioides bruguierae TaxID=2945102 RepID=A0A9X2IE07_9ACTN|nr:ArgP/LysG family DNA-binding transcriptional regulator [Nocardioides bruguierae]MCM0620331.1 ArgP/LysG family DNA-binding transcriptional regulator [Nocardioides bruguierae]
MQYPAHHLEALVAVVDHGTFEAAARALHVTPSALSQRVRALESSVGQVLVRRASPCEATDAGSVLVRLGRAHALLDAEAAAVLDPGAAGRTRLSVAINADSLATWFHGVLATAAAWDDVELRLHVEDQAFSADLLRSGRALAAVTDEPVAVQGCSTERVGAMRYLPVVHPALLARCTGPDGAVDWARLPLVRFNGKDGLQSDLLARLGVAPAAAVHEVPTSTDYVAALRVGLGWGMLPEPQADDPAFGTDVLVPLPHPAVRPLDVDLHWQRWRLDSALLDRLSAAVRDAARALRP